MKMDNEHLNDLNELHNLANITFQNVTNLAPALRQIVVNAKAYQKSVHTTCNLAVNFIDTLNNIAKAASVSEGATKKIGDVLLDIIETFKEIENMKLELTKLFINEVIIPLESRAEIQIGNMKGTHKSYNLENKFQTELFEKAQSSYTKIAKKSDRKAKRSPKLEAKVKENARTLDIEEQKLRKTREEGLRKALIEERRVYCFVTERMCAYGRGTVVYNNRISNFVNQKIPDWTQYIAKPTELPEESEDIIANPTGYKMGTVKRKVSKADKKDALKRGKSINNHYQTKYSTMDSRSSSRAGSRPSLSGVSGSISVRSNTSDGTCTPSSIGNAPGSPKIQKQPSPYGSPGPASPKGVNKHTKISSKPNSPKIITKASIGAPLNNGVPSTESADEVVVDVPAESLPLQRFISTKEELTQNEEAIAATIVASNNALKAENPLVSQMKKQNSPYGRSHSFSVQGRKDSIEEGFNFNRTGSTSSSQKKKGKKLSGGNKPSESSDFATRLSMIQTELHRQFVVHGSTDPRCRKYQKALYDHIAQDASQLSFQKDDLIIPTCDPTSGWQYGEHEKTKKSGWFPASYTVSVTIDDRRDSNDTSETVSTDSAENTRSDGKKPPPVAKKSFKTSGSKKSGGAGGTLPAKKKAKERKDPGNEVGVAEVSQLTASSSMPNVMHMANENGAEEPQAEAADEKHAEHIRISYIQNQDSFDTTDDESNNQQKSEENGYQSSDSADSLPPPPPPPPLSDDEETEVTTSEKVEGAKTVVAVK